jgi:hypothetical protein
LEQSKTLAFQTEELSLTINSEQLQHSACEKLLGIKINSKSKLKKTKLITSVLKYQQQSTFFQKLRNI